MSPSSGHRRAVAARGVGHIVRYATICAVSEQRKVHTAVLLERADKEALVRLAERGDRTFSQEVRRAIKRHLEQELEATTRASTRQD